jgi:hypothetical protein
MSTVRKVRLEGGPFDGQTVELNAQQRLVTLQWEDELLERDGDDGCVLYITRVGLATYRYLEPDLFEHVPTPTAIGDTERTMRGDR